MTYGVTDRLMVALGLPYLITKYYGTPGQNFFPHTIPIDDGNYHGTFQDYRIDLSYQALNGPVAVVPFVAAVIPSHSYTSFAHAAPGRDLHEYLLGFSLGGRLDRLLPLRGIGTGFYTHGGIAFESPQTTLPELFPIHDRIGHDSGIDLGGGLSYTLTGSTTIYVSYLTQVQGRGGHKIKDALSFGVSYSFSPAQLVRRTFPPKSVRTPIETP